MQPKKILGIILAVIFGILLCGGLFAVVLIAMLSKGYEVWLSVLVAFTPFIGTAIIMGAVWLILHLILD